MPKRAYKFRFYPSEEQITLLSQTFGCVRFVYNHILKWRTDAYYIHQQRVSYAEADKELTRLKQSGEHPWLNEVSSVPLQQCVRHQQTAFKNFFSGIARYPSFKRKSSRQSAVFTRSAFNYRDGQIYIAKSGRPLDIRWSRELPCEPSTVTISRDGAGRYFISCLCDFEPQKLPSGGPAVGVDLGIKDLLVLSNGSKIGNPKHYEKLEKRLAVAQRKLSRKKLGSSNRAKAKKKVARIHAKISDCRQDFLHKQSRRLVNENQVICVETLRVKNMLGNRKLSKSIADAGWGELNRQMAYKSGWAGREFVEVDQWFPSTKRCSCCGHVMKAIPLGVRDWVCPRCGAAHDRDVNAAINIRAAGLAALALGEDVSLASTHVDASSPL